MSELGAQPSEFDLAVIGAGPAGASLAILAARAGFLVVLIDARDPKSAPPADGRNFAIVRGSWRVLEAAGVTDDLVGAAQALNGLEAVDGGRHWFGAPAAMFGSEDLDGAGEPLGWMVEAGALQAALDRTLGGQDGVTHIRPARFRDFEIDSGGVAVSLEGGQVVRASVLVGCDGVNSPVRQVAGIAVEGRDYGKSVFAANVALARPHGGIARQLFTPEGPFATLPLTGDRANLAWYMKRGAAELLAKSPAAEIEAELNGRFEDFAGHMTLIGAPYAYPLILQIAERMSADRVALVGDAARRINPLAGQGLNLGFKDVAALVETLADARWAGLDIGASDVLDKYQAWRRFDAAATALAMDAVDRAYSNDNLFLKPLRGLALTAAHRLGPVRRAMARQASADQSSLPKLMRGEPLA